jgi:hypothetical protein
MAMLPPRIERGSLSAGVVSPKVDAAATRPLGKLLVQSEARKNDDRNGLPELRRHK